MANEASPNRRMRGRPFLVIALLVFIAALVGVVAWGDFLRPSATEGQLNTNDSGGQNLKPQSF